MQIRFYHWPLALLAAMTTHAALITGYPEDARPQQKVPRAGSSTLNIAIGPPGRSAPALSADAGSKPSEAEVSANPRKSETADTAAVAESPAVETERSAVAVDSERDSRSKEPETEARAGRRTREAGPRQPAAVAKPDPSAAELWANATTTRGSTPAREPRLELAQAAPLAGAIAGGASGGSGASTEGKSQASDSGGQRDETATGYLAELQAWLARHKQYPRFARQRRQEGRVVVYFRINRHGEVIEHRIEQGSGYELLDRAAEDMIRRAEPLPSMPEHMAQTELELTLPVQFELR